MAEIIDTAELGLLQETWQDSKGYIDDLKRLWIYCGIDSCISGEVTPKFTPLMTKENKETYEFELLQQAPALQMMLRGIRIDRQTRYKLKRDLTKEIDHLEDILDELANAVWEQPLNARSPQQLKEFFYKRMKLPEQVIYDKGKKRVSTNIESLEKLRAYIYARPIANTILAIRETGGLLNVVRSGIDKDWRIRSSYNVGATETGRWSSSKNVFGGGLNGQNVTERMRVMFIADQDMILGYPDFSQAESRVVAYCSGDPNYISACTGGSLHTNVAKMVWPDLGWTGDPDEDRERAAQPYYRHFSYYDMAKRGGHLTNYYGSAFTLAKTLKLDQSLGETFQVAYFGAFSGIRKWHQSVQRTLQTVGKITTALGRTRVFFGRRWDDSTLKEAIAYEPQSIVADATNMALYKIWRDLDHASEGREVQILSNQHDGILLQLRQARLEANIHSVMERMEQTILVNGKQMKLPAEMKVGYRWHDPDIPGGMYAWGDPRIASLERPTISEDLLDWTA